MNNPPPGTSGETRMIRVGLPLLADDDRACPRGRTLRARPLLTQDGGSIHGKPVEDFALGPLMRALDLVEHERTAVPRVLTDFRVTRRCHPAHLLWVRQALSNYLSAREHAENDRHEDGRPETHPVDHEWVVIRSLAEPDGRGARRYESTAWGRRYASADGSEREIWLPSVNVMKEDRSPAQIAAAAFVAAFGVPARSVRGKPYAALPDPGPAPKRVRVVAVGSGDGRHRVLADWDVPEVSRRYEALARPVLANVVEGTEPVPGSDCVNCKGLAGCDQPPRAPGLLDVPAPARPRKRRSVSASDLRVHAQCPAAFHLTRVLHLKDARPENPAIRRGRAVDAALNERHLIRRPRGCRDLPAPSDLPGLAAEEHDTALRMLARHRSYCPLDGLPPAEEVRVQPRITAYDPLLDVVLVADPDLLYTRSGGWVWRETKTAARPPRERHSLLAAYPQLALAVLLMSANVLGGDPRRSRIELEVLCADQACCEEIDPFEDATVREARAVVARLAAPWAVDETYAPSPGPHCLGCEARRWCTAASGHHDEQEAA